MKQTFLLIAACCYLFSACQPPRITDPPFTVGDYLPAFTASTVLNHRSGSFSLSDYKDKLIILDFMTTGCISCIRALPRLDSLQSQYGKRLQIVLVTPENTERVNAFLKSKRLPKNFSLPVIPGDSILNAWFPHQFISHEVWIYRNKVVAITAEEYVDDNNIELVFSGRPFHLPLKEDRVGYNYRYPVLTFNNNVMPSAAQPDSAAYSLFTSYMQGIPQQVKRNIDSSSQTRKIAMINQPILRLYAHAFGLPALAPSYIVLNVKDSVRFMYDSAMLYRDEWLRNNSYCYEAFMPLHYDESRLRQKIISDLNFYCRASGSLEKRMMDCYILQVESPKAGSDSQAVANREEFRSVGSFIYYLNHHYYSLPFVDETGRKGKFLLTFSREALNNISLLQKELEQYGMKLVPARREFEVLVISEN